jgi:hypothetical protein
MFKFFLPLFGLALVALFSAFATDPAPVAGKERTVTFIAPRGDCVDVYVRWRNGSQVTSFSIADREEHEVTLDDNGDYQYRAKLCSRNWCPNGTYTSVPFYTDDINISSYEMCN